MSLADSASLRTLEKDYVLLAKELVDLTVAQQLFTFVTALPVTLPNGQSQPVVNCDGLGFEQDLRGTRGED